MGIKIKLSGSAAKIVDKAVALALEQTATAVLEDIKTAQVMPMGNGTLQNQSTYVYDRESRKGVVAIIADESYARRLYYHPEYNFSKSGNANAGGKYFQRWVDGDKEEFVDKKFAEKLKENLK